MTNNWKVNDVVMLNSKQFTNGTNKLQHLDNGNRDVTASMLKY